MKRTLTIVLTFIVLCTCIPTISASEVSARYTSVYNVVATLTISPSGKAQCKISVGLVDALEGGTMSMTLHYKEGTQWTELKSWEKEFKDTDDPNLYLTGTYYVYKEGTYVLTGYVDVTTSLGSDYIDVESYQVDYPETRSAPKQRVRAV